MSTGPFWPRALEHCVSGGWTRTFLTVCPAQEHWCRGTGPWLCQAVQGLCGAAQDNVTFQRPLGIQSGSRPARLSGKHAGAGSSGFGGVLARRAGVLQERCCLGELGRRAWRGGVAQALLVGGSLGGERAAVTTPQQCRSQTLQHVHHPHPHLGHLHPKPPGLPHGQEPFSEGISN